MVTITKVNEVHLVISKNRLRGWVYGVTLDSDVTFNDNGSPSYKGMEHIKNTWYIQKVIYKLLNNGFYEPERYGGTVFAITDETIRVRHKKITLITYIHFYRLALLRYLEDKYNNDDNVLAVFVEITNNKLVTTRVKYKNREQEISIENYDEYRKKTIPYKISSRK